MKPVSVAAIALALAGCTSTPTGTSPSVRLTAVPSEVVGCKILGEVRGDHNMFGGAMIQIAIDDAENKIRAQAAKLGGNVVFLTRQATGWAGANFAGTAYRC